MFEETFVPLNVVQRLPSVPLLFRDSHRGIHAERGPFLSMPEEVSVPLSSYEEESDTREKAAGWKSYVRSIQSRSWKEQEKKQKERKKTSDDQRKKGTKETRVEKEKQHADFTRTLRRSGPREAFLPAACITSLLSPFDLRSSLMPHSRSSATCQLFAVWTLFSELVSSLATNEQCYMKNEFCSKRGTWTHSRALLCNIVPASTKRERHVVSVTAQCERGITSVLQKCCI